MLDQQILNKALVVVNMLCAIATMFAIILVALLLVGRDPRAAYRLLAHSQQLFEPEHEVAAERPVARPKNVQRQYLSPFTKKQVAARQQWRCAICRQLLDETYEIDHIKPVYAGGDNTMANLRALHRSCHVARHLDNR